MLNEQEFKALCEPLQNAFAHCQEHGRYETQGQRLAIGHMTREIWSGCPECKALEDTRNHLAGAERSAMAEQGRLERLLQQAAIPKRLLASSFDNFSAATPEQTKALNICTRYADRFERHLDQGTGLVLAGKVGTGKSHLACAILQALMPAHVGAYTKMMDLVRLLRSGWGAKGAKSEAQILDELAQLPLLVIDEIGVQYGSAGEQVHLFEVLDRRYGDMKPTILITNQDRDGFDRYIGERISDRLSETASWIQCDWPSHRIAARHARAAA